MRKDNAIFFAGGLVFGLLLGYFVFQTVSQTPGGFTAAGGSLSPAGPSMMGGGQPVESRRVLDPQEVAALEGMIERNPNDNQSRIQLGNLFLESGRDDQALPVLREAVERDPADNHARVHLAQALSNLGRLDEAVGEYQAILSRDPGNPQALLGLGSVRLYSQQDIAGGIEAWEELVRVAPSSREAQSIREELQALKTAHGGN